MCFRHFQFHVVDYPSPQSTNLYQGPGKKDMFLHQQKRGKEERQEGRRERKEEGGEERRKERKKGGKKRNVNVF